MLKPNHLYTENELIKDEWTVDKTDDKFIIAKKPGFPTFYFAPVKDKYQLAGPCPYMQDEGVTCRGNPAKGPIICNMLNHTSWKSCQFYYRMAELKDLAPNLWHQKPGPNTFCCYEWKYLFLDCAEASGFLAGALDIRIYPNDGKDVWRNYRRARFELCPFCGNKTYPSPEMLRKEQSND